MANKLCFIVCEYFKNEFTTVLEAEKITDIAVINFPAKCDHIQLVTDKVTKIINDCENNCEQIHIFGGLCATGLKDLLHNIDRYHFYNTEQCFYLLAGKNITDNYLRTGAHLLTPGILRHWRRYLEGCGFDQQTAQSFFGETTTKLVLLDTGVDKESLDNLKEFARFVNLPFETFPVGLDFLRLFLAKINMEWHLEKVKKSSITSLSISRQNLADYAMLFDLLNNLMKTVTEDESIERIIDLFTMLFAVNSAIYIPLNNGTAGNILSRPAAISDIEAAKNRLLGLKGDYSWTPSGNGFLLRIGYQDETLGVLEVDGFAFPEYKGHYLNLALIIARVCGLVITNSRTCQLLQDEIAERKIVEKKLWEINKTLDQRIAERTEALEKSNRELKLEIAERRRMEEERTKLREQLYFAQRLDSVGTLAGGIAHDFNNILTAIIGFGNLLLGEMKADDAARDYVRRILKSADRAANLTRGLLAYARKQPINPKPVSVNEIVREIESMLVRVLSEDIKLVITPADKDYVIIADIGQIEQVLMNLATNARDAMPGGGVLSIDTGLIEMDDEYIRAHGYGKPGLYVLITVSDTGVGIDEKTKEKIFEPFFTTKIPGKGTGLGLAIVYGIVKQHHGYINVHSEPGKGATFRIYLPIIEAEVEKAGRELHVTPVGGNETILMAEDEEYVREIIKAVLEKSGYTVIVAKDGVDAMDKFSANKDRIQCILLDVIMPNKNGWEIYETVRAMGLDVKVIFMSGYSKDVISRKMFLKEGLNFISKPVSPAELLKKVREVLDK
jgi:signal transduction histidine kinase